ncbi:TPA: hypothetical protein ACGE99_004655 [Serratia marcescens]|jgi:hypothetical protein|uniref:hypothetical protein n=1 Tax=Serratia TaxID=613 RepID=UPI0029CE6F1F|nr:hypothetical protein [Serratia marcescens]HEJ7314371.1 hypothetical protein [Serratia marcescens]
MKQLNIIASAGALLLVSMQALAGDIISSVVSTTTEFKVVNSAEASASVTARKDLAAGSVASLFKLADWTASVSAGTLAYRVNRATNPASPIGTAVEGGVASNSTDSSKKLNFFMDIDGTTLVDGWRVASQGITSKTSNIAAWGNQVLLPGRYPIAIDVAAYAF